MHIVCKALVPGSGQQPRRSGYLSSDVRSAEVGLHCALQLETPELEQGLGQGRHKQGADLLKPLQWDAAHTLTSSAACPRPGTGITGTTLQQPGTVCSLRIMRDIFRQRFLRYL